VQRTGERRAGRRGEFARGSTRFARVSRAGFK
jgi:hypothetical protein